MSPLEHQRAYRAKRVADGLCIECSEQEREPDGQRCWWCRSKNRERRRNDYRRNRAAGVCVDCRHAKAKSGFVRCEGCLATHAEKRSPEYMRRWRQQRHAAGLCVDCSRSRLPTGKRCEQCARRNLERTKARIARLRAAKENAAMEKVKAHFTVLDGACQICEQPERVVQFFAADSDKHLFRLCDYCLSAAKVVLKMERAQASEDAGS